MYIHLNLNSLRMIIFAVQWFLSLLHLFALDAFMESYGVEWLNWNGNPRTIGFICFGEFFSLVWAVMGFVVSLKNKIGTKPFLLNTVSFPYILSIHANFLFYWFPFLRFTSSCAGSRIVTPTIQQIALWLWILPQMEFWCFYTASS